MENKIFISKKSICLTMIGFTAFPLFANSIKEKAKKPNILFIAVDDLKPVLGCYGDTMIKTPNIDRLASQSTVFLKNYCQQAVCGPTRASMMTGLRPDITKVWDLVTKMRDINPDIVTIPQYFISQGYETSGIGKIFHPGITDKFQDKPSWSIPYLKPDDFYSKKFGEPALGYQNPQTKALIEKYEKEARVKGLKGRKAMEYVTKFIKPSVECVDVPDNAYEDGAMALMAKQQLIALSKDNKPFFFAVGFHKPHLPFISPKKYWDLYKRDEMPVAKFQEHAKNSPDLAYHNSGELRHYTDIDPLESYTDQEKGQKNHIRLPLDKQKELIHGYYAAVSYTDAQIGILLNTLDSLGMLKNTIIVLWGDHGWHLGDHDLWCKHTDFENATRAPLIISAPGMKAGQTKSMSEFVDVFPTLCDLAGIPIPANLDSKSLVPLMKDNTAKVNEYSVSQFPHNGCMGYSIRTDRYRLTFWMKKGFRSYQTFSNDLIVAKELYDYQNDPLETISVISDSQYKVVQKDLEAKLIAYFKIHSTKSSK
ncbi:MAG: sulfatase [Bacteroidetes bacterium]|nr:sulfatase [Bacteroidota bacterium]MCL6102332.1 sulfatase [Bacteroidota bacterium]